MSTNPNMKQSCSITAEHRVLALLLRRECRYTYILSGQKMQLIPARSPDLNPVKNLFNIVSKCIEAEILDQDIIHQSWDEFVQERVKFHVWSVSREQIYIDKTIASMPKKVKDIIKLKGPRTKY